MQWGRVRLTIAVGWYRRLTRVICRKESSRFDALLAERLEAEAHPAVPGRTRPPTWDLSRGGKADVDVRSSKSLVFT